MELTVDGLRKQRVLVVDDDPDTLEVLAILIELLGHEVRTALRGCDALEAVRELDPHLVMLDIALPDMNGYAVARELRKTGGRRCFLAAATGFGRPCDRERAKAAGFDDHLLKPFALPQVRRLLQQADAMRSQVA